MGRAVLGVLVVAAVVGLVLRSNRGLEDRVRELSEPFRPTALDVRGIWEAESYELAAGATHPVRGRIVFGEKEWQVVFFVMDAEGEPRRASAEGGSYAMRGDTVVFTHLYHLSQGDAVVGLEASAPRMSVSGIEDAAEEPTRTVVEGSRLTLFFPSGNRMSFERLEGPAAASRPDGG